MIHIGTEICYSPKPPVEYGTPEVALHLTYGGIPKWNLAWLAGPHLDTPGAPRPPDVWYGELQTMFLSGGVRDLLRLPPDQFLAQWLELEWPIRFQHLDFEVIAQRALASAPPPPVRDRVEGNVCYHDFRRRA